MIQDRATQDRATQDRATQDRATQDLATQDVATQDVAIQDLATQDLATQDVATQDSNRRWPSRPRFSLRAMLFILALAPLLLAGLASYFFPRSRFVPTDAQVIQAVLDSGQQLPAEPYEIVKQCTSSYDDPVRTVPLLGPVVLQHENYRCFVTGLDSNRSVSVDLENNNFIQVPVKAASIRAGN